MDKLQQENVDFWNELTAIHEKSAFYDVQSFMKGRQTLHDVELKELGDVIGKSLLHLQCHFGMDTLSWARLGAQVTGVDFSDNAIALARKLTLELGLDARFIHSNVYDLHQVLDDKFDIVFTSYGVLVWLQNLPEWAKVIHHFLKPGGTFLIVEEHPMTWSLDDNCEPTCMKLGRSYFDNSVCTFDDQHSYADPNTQLKHPVRHEWMHPLHEIFSATLGAGLQVESFKEYPFLMYQRFKWLVEDERGLFHMPEDSSITFPFLFSLKARRQK